MENRRLRNKFKSITDLNAEQAAKAIISGNIVNPELMEVINEDEVINLIKKSIPAEFLEQATKMKRNIIQKFLNLIYTKKDTVTLRDQLASDLVGVVGTVYANEYFKRKKYELINEHPIYDKQKHRATDVDIVFEDEKGVINFAELKTVMAIIEKRSEYPDTTIALEKKGKDVYLKPGQIIPKELIDVNSNIKEVKTSALETGKSVVRQSRVIREYVDRFNSTSEIKAKTVVLVFKNTIISENIRRQIEQYAEIMELPYDVRKVFENVNSLVVRVMNQGRNLIKPPYRDINSDRF